MVSIASVRLASANPRPQDFDWSRLPSLAIIQPIAVQTKPIILEGHLDQKAVIALTH
jgi:hypothetical protein